MTNKDRKLVINKKWKKNIKSGCYDARWQDIINMN